MDKHLNKTQKLQILDIWIDKTKTDINHYRGFALTGMVITIGFGVAAAEFIDTNLGLAFGLLAMAAVFLIIGFWIVEVYYRNLRSILDDFYKIKVMMVKGEEISLEKYIKKQKKTILFKNIAFSRLNL